MEFYLDELQCDCYASTETYNKEEITPEIIAKIKSKITDEESNIDMVYAMDNRGNWLSMYFLAVWVSIDIVFENGEHQYCYYNKKYEGVEDSELLQFGQDSVPKIGACDDMFLAADIFEEFALHGRLYPTTWVDVNEDEVFDGYYEEETNDYYRLYLTGLGENKAKTVVFLKKYFKDNDFEQTRKRTKQIPLLLCVAEESEVALLEKNLKEIGAAYKKEKISNDTYMELYYANPEDTLWDKLDSYLHS